MRPLFRKMLMLIHFVLDVSITICSLGLYAPGWHFNLDDIFKTFHFAHYSYWASPLDYVVLCLLRQVSLLIAIILIRRGKSKKLRRWMLIYDILGILGYIVAVVKLLAFDETGTMMSYPGIYMSTGSAVFLTFSLPIAIRYALLIKETEEVGYERLQSESRENTNVENGSTHSASTSSECNTENEEEDDAVTREEKEKRLPLSKHLWQIMKLCGKQWKWFTAAYSLLLIDCILNLVQPALYSQMMSTAIQMKSFDVLKTACVDLAIVQFSAATCNTVRYICMQYAERLTARNIRVGLFKAILHQDISFFDENKTGQLMSRITHDSESISNSLPAYIATATRNLVMIFGSAPIMLYCSWQLSIGTFITFPIAILVTNYYGSIVEKLSEQENDATAASNETVEEVVSGIRSFAAEKMEYMRYTRNTDAWFKISIKTVVLTTFYNYFFATMWNIKDLVVYLYGGYLTLQGRMAPEALLTYAFYQWRLHAALNEFSSLFSDVMKTIGSSRKVIHIMNRIPELDYEVGSENPDVVGNIIFENVEFAYPTRKTANILNGISLSIEPGKTVALVGPSGNGKSTLVSLLQLFYSPQSGRILLDGTPIQQIDHRHYHTKIALVAQEPTLFSGTIRENILYGIEDGTDDDMMRVSEMANVHEFVSKMEKGYDTTCGEKGVQMSGGQKQRIAIARALIRNPRVLILDEATSALDAESESMVQEALNRCAKERTVLVIAHRLSTVRRADRIAVIEKGSVTEMGTHDDLMKNRDGLYFKLVQKQLGTRIDEEEEKPIVV
ncbi:Protein CBG21809 [Caenorhabditis briggsae]|uniref:Protein CBG21809 n=1 Tax=Caenorhabditis briggsae TaxID=6238 RepID=A8Y0V2_CAEBR|nr:Protein CBG21809 [Caenorhabditis briggsae]CAP38522.1 Protein CBG21809 [Caenorhabditis briggsae]